MSVHTPSTGLSLQHMIEHALLSVQLNSLSVESKVHLHTWF